MKDIKDLWKSQPVEEFVVMNLQDLKKHADLMRTHISRRNWILYAYAIFNIVTHVWVLSTGRMPAFRLPVILMLMAHLFVAWQVWKRFTPRRAPLENSGKALLDFQRQELERQHGAVAKAWLWYILPFWPAFLWELAIWFQRIDPARPGSKSGMFALEMTVVGGIFFWSFVWMLFSRHATKLEWELDRLRRVRAE